MPVADDINYSLRPNKNVERKLIVEALSSLHSDFRIEAYRYIGMGSLWFVDFHLMHRHLGVRDMVSIEDELVQRAKFNIPFACVRVEAGKTTDVLPNLDLDRGRAIVWLDHESGINGGVLEDIALVCSELPSGSILILTVNASTRTLSHVLDDDDRELTDSEALRYFAGPAAPEKVPEELNKVNYPPVVAEVLFRAISRAIRTSGRTEFEFLPMFNLHYNDGAPMVTVCGMIASGGDVDLFRRVQLAELVPYITDANRTQHKLDVPVLTPKEKRAFDRLLPPPAPLTAGTFKNKIGFGLERAKIEAYEKVYKYYPQFAEHVE